MKTQRLPNTLDPVAIQAHVECRTCGRVVDIEAVAATAGCLSVADERGFAISQTEVFYRGLCPDCLSKNQDEFSVHDCRGPR